MGAAAFILGTYVGRVVARRSTLHYAVGVGAGFLAIGGALLPLGVGFGPGHVAEFIVPVAVFMVGIGIICRRRSLPRSRRSPSAPALPRR